MRSDDNAPVIDGHVQAEMSSRLGSSLHDAKRSAWGFKNETWDVTLDDDRHVVVQIFRDREDASRRVEAMRQLRRLTELPIPRVLAGSLDAPSPWAAYARLDGEPGYERAGWNLAGETWPAMAREMGIVIGTLRAIPARDVVLPDLWARSDALVEAALRWVVAIRPHISRSIEAAVMGLVETAPATLGAFTPAVCHGDLGPANVLFSGTTISGVLDFEDARLGHPLLDVAWWNWLVRAHTPEAFERSWESFLGGVGIDAGQEGLADQMHTLTVLRLLETADTFRRTQPEKYASWGARIEKELSRA